MRVSQFSFCAQSIARSAVSPTFSSGKLRRSVEHLELPIGNFFDNLDDLIRRGETD